MTLITIDQFRVTADSYAVEDDHGKKTVIESFPKILRTPDRIIYTKEDRQSFKTVAFCGSATTFVPLWETLSAEMERRRGLTEHDVKRLCDKCPGEAVLLIFPFSNACLTVLAGQAAPAVVNWYEGDIHAFGDGYVKPFDGAVEYRSWYSIFFNAWDAGTIHGPAIHFLPHQNQDEPIKDTLKPESTVKKVRRRLPWGNRRKT